jgi:hypothetical protein
VGVCEPDLDAIAGPAQGDRRVAAGDFNIWLPSVRSKDEVSDLNRALRTMRTR